ncbi:MAG TPA: methyltransferase domain-containing protein [Candidatus Paceibacterota bacterium]|nr:methyltransferase domain-containing protein [Candidatus Paceibacterota bacterium]
MKKDTSWGKVADWYDELLEGGDDTYQTQVILPNLLRILDVKPGDRVLDIACGQGFFARAFQEAGASVTGVDVSKELITLASKESRNISYHVASSTALPVPDASFDKAVIVLALGNIADIDGTFKEARRALVPRGRLVLVVNHPAFRVPRHSDWQYEEASKTQYRRIGRYLSGETVVIDMHPGEKHGEKTLSYHRSLQDISKSLRKNGFATLRLEEWISHKRSGAGPRQLAEDTARKEIPLFLTLEAMNL